MGTAVTPRGGAADPPRPSDLAPRGQRPGLRPGALGHSVDAIPLGHRLRLGMTSNVAHTLL
ncbi:MAG: hypothetical protein ACFCBW_02905 [Candidatus Competibacterales bacterium]